MPIIDGIFYKLELERVKYMVDKKVLDKRSLEVYLKDKNKSRKSNGST